MSARFHEILKFSVALSVAACSATSGTEGGSGGSNANAGRGGASGGAPNNGSGGATGGQVGSGGSLGGSPGSGGTVGNGGSAPKGGSVSTGGSATNGGSNAAAGGNAGKTGAGGTTTSTGGASAGGSQASGGSSAGGSSQGGKASSGGAAASGGGAAMGGAGGAITQPTDPCAPRAGYRNLYSELLGKTQAEVDAKVNSVYESLFHSTNDKVYYESGTDEAYILDVNDNDVRTEGMSYGMMVAVQLDKKDEFNKLWKWARSHMYISSGAIAGYFAWQCNPNGSVISNSSAPDGEEYFATALILASKRWGDGTGIFAYSTQAQALLDALTSKGNFNSGNHLVTFGPNTSYSDASYVLPAFYEVWACFDSKNKSFWKSAITAGRAFFPKACNSSTGLAPNYSNYDGSPYNGSHFQSDAWRVVGNIMMDHNLFNADPWQTTFAQTFAKFFKTASAQMPVPDEFNLDGTATHTNADPSKGLVAQNAMVAFGVPAADGTPFVQALWDTPVPTGQYRYYDGMLYILATLHVSGNFRVSW